MINVELLIKEIDVSNLKDKNSRYLRENLRRIKEYLDGLQNGAIAIPLPNPSVYNGTDTYNATTGQTSFNLSATPTSPANSRMLINGVEQRYGSTQHFSITGNVATFYPVNAGFSLEALNEFSQPDIVTFHYMK